MNFFFSLVRAQELDLHRLIDLEINLSNEHHGLHLDLEVNEK
jgi:hypothetical protein